MNREYTIIKDRLVSEFGYPESGANLVIQKLSSAHNSIQDAFWLWWESDELPDIEVGGTSIDELISTHNMMPIAAFLTLDWLIREPEIASQSLRKGHDNPNVSGTDTPDK